MGFTADGLVALEVTVTEDDAGVLTVTDANKAATDLLDTVFTPVDAAE